jgi:hypothetical protein
MTQQPIVVETPAVPALVQPLRAMVARVAAMRTAARVAAMRTAARVAANRGALRAVPVRNDDAASGLRLIRLPSLARPAPAYTG